MSKKSGFLKYDRKEPRKKDVEKRLTHFREFEIPLSPGQLSKQATRCMDCGIPYCHSYGCPVSNRVPEWIEMTRKGQWERALALLHSTDNFPEITGRICPAPCEAACTLNIDKSPVTIRHIELQIIERGFKEGWVTPQVPRFLSGKTVAVIGSGPAGLAAAQQLARKGHMVTVFEKDDRIGGLLRYGIPDFKLEKRFLDRRLDQMLQEGVVFEPSAHVGVDILPHYLLRRFDAVLLAIGASVPRELEVPGRKLEGVYQAVPYLTHQNRRNAGDAPAEQKAMDAKGKNVVVIGGGDTGADCVGTANRQGAKSVTQIEIMPKPSQERPQENPWPTWPRILYTGSSHEEGCNRLWSVATKKVLGKDGHVTGISCVEMDWKQNPSTGKWAPSEKPGSAFNLDADLVLLSMGFLCPAYKPFVDDLNLDIDTNGNIAVDKSMKCSKKGVFACGDAVSGASLIVRAIHSARQAAEHVDRYLTKE